MINVATFVDDRTLGTLILDQSWFIGDSGGEITMSGIEPADSIWWLRVQNDFRWCPDHFAVAKNGLWPFRVKTPQFNCRLLLPLSSNNEKTIWFLDSQLKTLRQFFLVSREKQRFDEKIYNPQNIFNIHYFKNPCGNDIVDGQLNVTIRLLRGTELLQRKLPLLIPTVALPRSSLRGWGRYSEGQRLVLGVAIFVEVILAP